MNILEAPVAPEMRTNVPAICLTDSDTARFWSKVDRHGPTIRAELGPCWLWTASTQNRGYGQFSAGGRAGKKYSTHRVAFLFCNGPIADGLCVLHHCDNPPCCNPAHLFLGTNKNNSEDMVAKGRQAQGASHASHLHPESLARGDRNGARLFPDRLRRGEMANQAKLTAAMVLEIRTRYTAGRVSQSALSREFGVCQMSISLIVRRKVWRHV